MKWSLSYTQDVPYLSCLELDPILNYLFREGGEWKEDKSKDEVRKELREEGRSDVVFRTQRGDYFIATIEYIGH